MQAIQKHGPQIKEIQKKYKGDRQKMNEEVMAFYKENHINPAASCLPMLIQLPVFFALYLTLKHYSHHIKGSWLHVVPNIADKPTAHWSGYLLVAIYIGSQVASTFFMGAQMDKMQRNIFLLLPLIMITVVLRFPIGLLMYWMTTNLWTVGQGLVTRRLVPRTPAPAMPSFGRRQTPAPAAAKASDRTGNPGCAQAQARGLLAAAAAPRQAQEGRLTPVSDDLAVEATGETVGEAKWKALRELERLAPGLDKASVEFQVVSEGERGLLGVGYTPARVVASAPAGQVPPPGPARFEPTPPRPDESELEQRVRELVERVVGATRHRREGRCEAVGRRAARHLHRRRPRPADRPSRPDDRLAPVSRERDSAPRGSVGLGDDRCSRLPRPPPRDARGHRPSRG